ncbi:calcium/calmodulin-regulated receptor-like kinase 1 [Rutidosis leptorrhynchoides]|uniref:calcium/calmodulin-regulated receptor-like kinase 1 n=1 Tax=Rutidosis leptorrhynchoides TaxID=125765 RepID=UPI003A9991DC
MKAKASGLIIGISSGVVIGALSAIITLVCFRFHRRRSQIGNNSSKRASTVPIRANGANFTSIIGQGAFGPVYKAAMSTGETVAVKVLATNSKQGEKEFHTEGVDKDKGVRLD